MPIELICKGCSRKLRVGDEHAGKHARCPECGEINPISSAAAQASEPPGPAGASTNPHAPVGPRDPFAEVASPFSSPSNFSPVARSSEPGVAWTPPATPASANPFGDVPAVTPAGYAAGGVRQESQRGALILVFAILGFFFCFIFSILAWLWGAEDLRKMRRGAMDPSGMSLTQVGMILGIIGCAIDALVFVMFLLIAFAGVARASW